VDAEPSHLNLFSQVFAEKWRTHSKTNSVPWVVEHAVLTNQWATYRRAEE
jgi:hypothetical protein